MCVYFSARLNGQQPPRGSSSLGGGKGTRGQVETCKTSGSEEAHCHFCFILSAKTCHMVETKDEEATKINFIPLVGGTEKSHG